MTHKNSLRIHRWIPAYAGLALLALAASVLAILHAPPVQGQTSLTVAFGSGVTIPSKSYTFGLALPSERLQAHTPEWEALQLPEVNVTVPTGTYYHTVSYTASNLPRGLNMGDDRIIYGTPTQLTFSTPRTVTYTATVVTYTRDTTTMVVSQSGTGSASLTFTVTVARPVAFNAEAQSFFASNIIAYAPVPIPSRWYNPTLPAAQGGAGTLTYSLIDNDTGRPLADVVPSLTFNASTRTLGGTLPAGARYAVTFIATDQNGATAQGHTEVREGIGGI